MWTGDNLDVLRGLNSDSVDLIYMDPPFNSNRDYAAPIGSRAAGAAFRDTWTLDDVDQAWHGEIADREPKVYAAIDNAGVVHGTSMKSYLVMMAVRLLELRRVLKATGSLYVHCDETADSYLRMLLDAVFGKTAFGNEIVWRRSTTKGNTKKNFAANHDVLLRYRQPTGSTWNPQYQPHDRAYVEKSYRHQDADGRRYQLTDLTNPNPDRPNLTYEFLGVHRVWRWTRERMQRAFDAGLVVQSAPGRVPRYKRYLDEQPGPALGDVWTDIKPVQSKAKERLGYPTQKPLALLDRVIKASSNPGDVVLDPFCGCATACVSAESLGRQWIGIDLSPVAASLVESRLREQFGVFAEVHHRTDIPRRTDLGELPNYRTHKHALFGKQEGHCGGCRMAFPFRNFEIDHVIPRAKGGSDHADNLQLLCGACNRAKGTGTQGPS